MRVGCFAYCSPRKNAEVECPIARTRKWRMGQFDPGFVRLHPKVHFAVDPIGWCKHEPAKHQAGHDLNEMLGAGSVLDKRRDDFRYQLHGRRFYQIHSGSGRLANEIDRIRPRGKSDSGWSA